MYHFKEPQEMIASNFDSFVMMMSKFRQYALL